MTPKEGLAWAAGLFEGEGCFTYGKREPLILDGHEYFKVSPRIKVAMTDKDVLERLVKIIGLGRVGGPYGHYNPNAKPLFEWSLEGRKAIAAIKILYPFLLSRRKAQVDRVMKDYDIYQTVVKERARLHRFGVIPGPLLRNKFKPRKLSVEIVEKILSRRGERCIDLAKEYEVTPQYIGQLFNGRNKVTERFGTGAIK